MKIKSEKTAMHGSRAPPVVVSAAYDARSRQSIIDQDKKGREYL